MEVGGWSFSLLRANRFGEASESIPEIRPRIEQSAQPPEGRETLRCASAVGPARAPTDRTKGGPTGTTELVCGRGRGAYWSLHYAAAMVRLYGTGRYSVSIPIRGVSA